MRRNVSIACGRYAAGTIAAAAVLWMLSLVVHGSAIRLPERQDAVLGSGGLPAGDGERAVRTKCLGCHGVDLIVQQRLARAGWSREVDKMIGWGAMVDSSERETLVSYLETHFGEHAARRKPDASGQPGAAIVAARCLTCHDEHLIEQQRLAVAGWAAEVEKMIRWGATLTEPEKAALIDYLAGGMENNSP